MAIEIEDKIIFKGKENYKPTKRISSSDFLQNVDICLYLHNWWKKKRQSLPIAYQCHNCIIQH